MSNYYTVLIDGVSAYNPSQSDKILINPVVRPSIEEAGSFDFTIDKSHALYDDIIPYGSDIEVREDGETIFFGRPLPPTKNIFNQKVYHCEGAVAFLNDIVCPPMSKFVSRVWEDTEGAEGEGGQITGDMPADDQGLERRTITYTQYIEYVFEQYNRYQTKTSRKLYLRNYNPEWEATIVYDSDYKTCLEVLRSEILPKMGGYLVASKDAVTGHIMIDITTNFSISNQPIRAGTNLLDYMSTHNPFYTAVIAKGGNPNNDYSTGTEPVKMDQPMYYDSLYILSRYGVICAYKEFPECTTLTDLEARCTEFLASQQFEDYSLDLSATDLHIINDEYDLLKVGKSVVFSSTKHHETPVSLLITSMEIHLDTGEKKLKLGSSKKRTITRDVTRVNVKVENNQTVVGDDIIVEDSVVEGSSNPISSGAVYDALQGGGGGGGGGDGWIHQINGVTQATGTINFVT